jgi:GNAT superfamily N-acetyltransferase
MAEPTIRDYAAGDHDAVLRLNAAAWADVEAPEARGGIDAADLHAIESVYLNGGAFILAVDEKALVGMAGLQRLTEGTYELRRMRVALSQQRRGIGRLLTEASEERARSLGARRIVLSTSVQQAPARALYEAMGYKQTRTSVLEDRHGRFYVVHYEKRLG